MIALGRLQRVIDLGWRISLDGAQEILPSKLAVEKEADTLREHRSSKQQKWPKKRPNSSGTCKGC